MHGDACHMCRYACDIAHVCRWEPAKKLRSDVDRLKSRASTCLVATLPLPSGVRATAAACQNSVPSSVLLAATSDCSLHLLDAAAGAPVATATGYHSRSICGLGIVPVTPFSDAATAAVASNAVMSVSRDSTALLWDLRCMQVTRRFASDRHVTATTRGTAVGAVAAAVSPCGRFVACGAADPAGALIYDVRTSGVLESVVWPPRFPRVSIWRAHVLWHVSTVPLHTDSFQGTLHLCHSRRVQYDLVWSPKPGPGGGFPACPILAIQGTA